LRLLEEGNIAGPTMPVGPDLMLREVYPELEKIAKSANGDHKKWLREFLTTAPESDDRRNLDEVFRNNP
jgi:hypothetical protein